MSTRQNIPRLVITPGEPSGIGPDIVIAAAHNPFNAELIIVANPELITSRAKLLGVPLDIIPYEPDNYPTLHQPGSLKVLEVQHNVVGKPGYPSEDDASYVLDTLKIACTKCLHDEFSAMVTAPVHKAIINQAGYPFTGHTEYLAKICGEGYPVMMLADSTLRVALVTTHLPLSSISETITRHKLDQTIRVLWNDLQNRFGIQNPQILVCGLNPHAGEDGYIGKEEKETIIPVLESLREKGLQIIGPVPADTAFTTDSLENVDVVLTMYHDQGLPVLKARGFGEIVNITLGLPVIRTSVDHGTALQIAGTGKAKCTSLVSAINYAIYLSGKEKLTSMQDDNFNSAKINR